MRPQNHVYSYIDITLPSHVDSALQASRLKVHDLKPLKPRERHTTFGLVQVITELEWFPAEVYVSTGLGVRVLNINLTWS